MPINTNKSEINDKKREINPDYMSQREALAYASKRGFDDSMRKAGLNRLFLHAHDLTFYHPKNEATMRVEAPLDKTLKNTLLKLRDAKL